MSATVLELLAALGDTELEVAVSLRERGIKGRPGNARCCPVANYLTPGVPCVAVDEDSVAFSGKHSREYVLLPGPVADFVIAFDHGAYPDLVSENP